MTADFLPRDDDFNPFTDDDNNDGVKERLANRLNNEFRPSTLVAALVITVASLPFVLVIMLLAFNQTTDRRLTMIDEDEFIPDIFPFRWPQDYLGFGFAVLGLLLAAGGGTGAGGILIPVYILFLGFPVKHAIALACVTVLGGAIASYWLSYQKLHPDHPERPAIDWDLMLLLQPMTIAGALIGTDLNAALPDVLLLVLLLILLTVTARETLKKANKMHQDEETRIEQAQATLATFHSREYVDFSDKACMEIQKQHGPGLEYHKEANECRESKLIKDECTAGAIKLVYMLVLVIVFNLLEGIFLEGATEWIMEAFVVLILILFWFYARSSILERQNSDGPILSEVTWDESNTTIYPMISIAAGLVAGMFGIGGGIINGPIMLALGVHPQVASATSSCGILFSSTMATLCFYMFGLLKVDYAAFCMLVGFMSTYVGQIVTTRLLERFGNRNSYLVYCIGSVVAISALAMGIESIIVIFSGNGH